MYLLNWFDFKFVHGIVCFESMLENTATIRYIKIFIAEQAL